MACQGGGIPLLQEVNLELAVDCVVTNIGDREVMAYR